MKSILFPQHTTLYHLHNWILISLRKISLLCFQMLLQQLPRCCCRRPALVGSSPASTRCQCQQSGSSSPLQPFLQCGGQGGTELHTSPSEQFLDTTTGVRLDQKAHQQPGASQATPRSRGSDCSIGSGCYVAAGPSTRGQSWVGLSF